MTEILIVYRNIMNRILLIFIAMKINLILTFKEEQVWLRP